MNDTELDALEAAAKAATPGPWEHERSHVVQLDGTPVANCVSYKIAQSPKNAAYIAAANPAAILELITELRKRTSLLEEVYEEIGAEKIGGACNVCATYTHKTWCFYPQLAKLLGKPLDEFDLKFLKRMGEL